MTAGGDLQGHPAGIPKTGDIAQPRAHGMCGMLMADKGV